jgi:hypothetical protein
MLTPIDQIANQNHLQLVKAALPYIRPQTQKQFSILIKMMELQNILRFYKSNSCCIHACDTSSEQTGMLDMLTNIRNYCEGEEAELVDQWIQFASTLELYSLFMQSSDDLSSIFGANS